MMTKFDDMLYMQRLCAIDDDKEREAFLKAEKAKWNELWNQAYSLPDDDYDGDDDYYLDDDDN